MRMRSELALVLVAAFVRSAAADVTALVAADNYVATDRQHDIIVASLAWSAHVEWRTRRRDLTIDVVDREALIGGAPRRELHELAYVDRSLPRLELTLGRFRVPGGLWLIADGGAAAVRWNAIELAVYGGSRSFTNGRTETLLTGSPQPMPLAGAAFTRRGDVQAKLAYTLTRDRIDLPSGDGVAISTTRPDHYLDAELVARIGERLSLTGGATVGSRYLVTYPRTAARATADPVLETMWFGSQAAYAIADVRMGSWRTGATVAALRTRLARRDDTTAAISGSFIESTARATWRDRTWRLAARYRARVFADRRQAHRALASMALRRGVLDLQLSGGIDIHAGAAAAGHVDRTHLLYRASVGRKTSRSELAVGAAAVSTIGDELPVGAEPDAPEQRAPYTLEARSHGFARAFATWGPWFAGGDLEIDLHGEGARALLQLGWAR